MSRVLKLILIFFVFLVGIVFYLRNDQFVQLDYYVDIIELRFSFWIILALGLGSLLGILVSLPAILKLKRENTRLLKRVKISEKEINNLRTIPVKDSL